MPPKSARGPWLLGPLYIRFHFRHFTGVVPLRSKPDVVSLGRSARRDIESRLHITIVTAVATGRNGKAVLCVLLQLHGQRGWRTNRDDSQSLKDKHLRKACTGNHGSHTHTHLSLIHI